MPKIVRPLTHTGITAEHERKLRRHAVPDRRRFVPFTLAGEVSVSTSPPWTPDVDCAVSSVRALLGTAGTSDTVVEVFVNGSSVGTVTLGSGDTNESASFTPVALAANTDLLTVGVTTAGAGAEDLTVLPWVG